MFGNTNFTSAHASTRVTDRRMAAQDGSIESRKIGSAFKNDKLITLTVNTDSVILKLIFLTVK